MDNIIPFPRPASRGNVIAIGDAAQTIYRETANGRLEYWTYADGARVYLNHTAAERDISAGRAKLVRIGA